MKMNEITGLSDLDLKERIAQSVKLCRSCGSTTPLRVLRAHFQLRQKRRDIARMLTELNRSEER